MGVTFVDFIKFECIALCIAMWVCPILRVGGMGWSFKQQDAHHVSHCLYSGTSSNGHSL